jgi:competence ComEA-like helix-hairpin-helix protein
MKMIAIALFATFAAAVAGNVAVTLVYTNDLHGELLAAPDRTVAGEPKPMLGGIARLAALVKAEKGKGNCLVLDAGDFMRGSPEANRTRGMAMIDAMSLIDYDAVCVGERDVAWVMAGIDSISQRVSFRLLGDRSLSAHAVVDMPVTRPSLLRDVGEVKVGLIGLLDEELVQPETADSVPLLSGLTPEHILARELNALLSQNADIIVVLAHMPLWKCRELARQFPAVTAFIGGHEGKVFELGAMPQESMPLIAEAGARGQRVGICRILLDSATRRVKEIRNRISNLLPDAIGEDSAAAAWVAARTVAGMSDSLGFCAQDLDTLSLPGVVANLARRETGAEIAIFPYASLDWSLLQGRLTRRDASRVVPYEDALVRVTLDDVGLAGVLNTALAHDDLHQPASAGVSYEVALTDLLHGDLPPRAIHVKPEKFTPKHDVLLTRALAVSAGLPGKSYKPVGTTLTGLFLAAVKRHDIGVPGSVRGKTQAPGSVEDNLVNINTATSEELQTLPGIGPKTAEKIIEYREANGPFQRIEDIMKVKGIAQKKFAKLKDKIAVAR